MKIKFANELASRYGSPTDFTDSLLGAVGQPTIFGTPLVVRQPIKFSLSTAYRFGQNLNLMYVLIEVYISGRPWPTAKTGIMRIKVILFNTTDLIKLSANRNYNGWVFYNLQNTMNTFSEVLYFLHVESMTNLDHYGSIELENNLG